MDTSCNAFNVNPLAQATIQRSTGFRHALNPMLVNIWTRLLSMHALFIDTNWKLIVEFPLPVLWAVYQMCSPMSPCPSSKQILSNWKGDAMCTLIGTRTRPSINSCLSGSKDSDQTSILVWAESNPLADSLARATMLFAGKCSLNL